MANSNIAGYDISIDPFAPNLLHEAPTPEGEADITASASVDNVTGTPSVVVTKTKTGQAEYNFDFAFHGLKGQQGERGIQGQQGAQGPRGLQGIQGVQGAAGAQGVGISSITFDHEDIYGNNVYNITLTNGSISQFTANKGATGPQGPQGPQGVPGDGEDGVGISDIQYSSTDLQGNYIYTITLSNGDTFNITCPIGPQGVQGPQGIQGLQGPQGKQGVQGVQGPAGPGVPTGGTAGQVLAKVDGTDYNCQWVTPSGGEGSPVLTKSFTVTPTAIASDTVTNACVVPANWISPFTDDIVYTNMTLTSTELSNAGISSDDKIRVKAKISYDTATTGGYIQTYISDGSHSSGSSYAILKGINRLFVGSHCKSIEGYKSDVPVSNGDQYANLPILPELEISEDIIYHGGNLRANWVYSYRVEDLPYGSGFTVHTTRHREAIQYSITLEVYKL